MKKIFVLIFALTIILISTAYAIRISPDSIRIEFEPNLEKSFVFMIGGASKVEIYKSGALSEYVQLDKTILDDGSKFTVTVKLPDHITTPGDNIILIGAREYVEKGGTVGGIAAIQTPIVIRVPYPGIYADMEMSIPDASVDEIIGITINIHNLGTDDIKSAKASIDIFDSDKILTKNVNTNQASIKSRSEAELRTQLNTSGMKSGTYTAIANVYYDENNKTLEKNFRIGVLSVKVLNYTREFLRDKIGKFEIDAMSKWNSKIDDLYAEIKIFNGTKIIDTLKTPTASLEPWQVTKLSTFLDTTGLGEGIYNIKITIYYAGTSSTLDGEVYILKPEESFISKYINITTILIVFVVLLIIFNAVILLKRKKK